MILPTKHIPAHQALIGTGAVILQTLQQPLSISKLWETVRASVAVGTYERFVLALDMLHIIGVIDLHQHIIRRVNL